MLRRETMIALRARHTAFRIATDILYPHQSAPPPPPASQPTEELPPPPPDSDKDDATLRHVAWGTVWVAVLVTYILVVLLRGFAAGE